jgi:hypothetical protein
MITEKIQKLKEIEIQAAKLKASIESERESELASLPAKYGYDSAASFIKALKQASGRKGKGKRGRKPGKVAKKAVAAQKTGARKRARITDETKEQVKALVTGGVSGSKIAKQLGISVPSVQNIKKELGLVKARVAKVA